MSTIFVTNNSDKKLLDGFAGAKYVFEPGETVEIPTEAARHIFGYGVDDKHPHLVRLGWIKTEEDWDAGVERLSNWVLSDQPPKKNQSLSPLVERVPLTSVKKLGGKVLNAA